jgi:Flp pilus assembly protein TadD
LLLLDTDQYQAAIPELEKACERMKHVPGVFSALGLAYARAGRDEEAMRARSIAQQLSKSTASSPAPQP